MLSSALNFKRIVVLAMVVALGFIFLPGFVKGIKLKIRNRQLQEAIKGLEEENARLSEELEKLNNDPNYAERVAREEMGMVKEGEVVYTIKEKGEPR